MIPHDILTLYSAKMLEYGIAVLFLLLFIPFWRYVQGPADGPGPRHGEGADAGLQGCRLVPDPGGPAVPPRPRLAHGRRRRARHGRHGRFRRQAGRTADARLASRGRGVRRPGRTGLAPDGGGRAVGGHAVAGRRHGRRGQRGPGGDAGPRRARPVRRRLAAEGPPVAPARQSDQPAGGPGRPALDARRPPPGCAATSRRASAPWPRTAACPSPAWPGPSTPNGWDRLAATLLLTAEEDARCVATPGSPRRPSWRASPSRWRPPSRRSRRCRSCPGPTCSPRPATARAR